MPGRERDPAGQGNGDPEGERDERMEAPAPSRRSPSCAHLPRTGRGPGAGSQRMEHVGLDRVLLALDLQGGELLEHRPGPRRRGRSRSPVDLTVRLAVLGEQIQERHRVEGLGAEDVPLAEKHEHRDRACSRRGRALAHGWRSRCLLSRRGRRRVRARRPPGRERPALAAGPDGLPPGGAGPAEASACTGPLAGAVTTSRREVYLPHARPGTRPCGSGERRPRR